MQSNSAQQAFIDSPAEIVCALAGPGSGKTRSMVARIVSRLRLGLVRQSEIGVLTFSNAAAHEIAERIRKEVPGFTPGYMGTIHGYCFQLLQKFGTLLGYRSSGLAIISEDLWKEQLREVAKEFCYKISDAKLFAGIDRAAEQCHRELRHRLKRNNMVSYDKILEDGLTLLGLPEVRSYKGIGVSFRDLYIDEAQDSSEMDWRIFKNIPHLGLCVIGDPDQAIYGFRGGDASYLKSFYMDCHEDDVAFGQHRRSAHILELNYRSVPEICEAATRLMQYDFARIIHKATVSATEGLSGHVNVIPFDSEPEEDAWLLDRARRAIEVGTVAILSRNHANANRAISLLEAAQIPIRYAHVKMPPGWETAMSFLSLMVNPDNEIMASRWLVDFYGPAEAESLLRSARIGGTSIPRLIEARFGDAMQSLPAALRKLVDVVPFETVELLKARAEMLETATEPTISDLLHDLWEADYDGEEGRGVFIGTIHSAKGREWDHVILLGFEDGCIPHKKADVAEERRVAYVGLTRAKRCVDVTHCLTRKATWNPRQILELKPSPFIDELIP